MIAIAKMLVFYGLLSAAFVTVNQNIAANFAQASIGKPYSVFESVTTFQLGMLVFCIIDITIHLRRIAILLAAKAQQPA